ncbi:polysaccharide deacetylase family protein [Flagellimonas marinaquae]|uniref:polysaccharide deacetylase family protein n=1 Tax=Flagellimonas marinaquae TaxID=254955 RepID=UPI002075647B|nr:polysaccharide deacetylase family protein [Allomuricauda aquimarina]USD24816.1 polysaccharide deacetylase family protein [Allomuricauda aquimarina]
MKQGKFIISLDFELFWGVRDKRSLTSYGNNIAKVHTIVPEMLSIFKEYNVHATFATVGFLFAKNKEELVQYSPQEKPQYKDSNLSPYLDNFTSVKEEHENDLHHYAVNLINLIKNYPEHEIGSHTFSHFYCKEEGQTATDFEADIKAALRIAKDNSVVIESLVFPRNQFRKDYVDICSVYGIRAYRGNEKVWFQNPESEHDTSFLKRVFRTFDCYVDISGPHTYKISDLAGQKPYNIPSSRFLRPYKEKGGALLEQLKIRRIKNGMSYAAKNNEVYHLWWHPHNFGANTKENFVSLIEILKHYRVLHEKYGFESMTMLELANEMDSI